MRNINLKKGNMKIGEILIAPEGCAEYLTPFKEYEVKIIGGEVNEFGSIPIIILDNEGVLISTITKGSAHLGGQDWIIKTEAEKEWNDLNGLIELTQEQAKRKEYLTKVLRK